MTECKKLKERTIKLVGEIISNESAKPDNEADFELIEECEELLCELVGDKITLSDKEINERINKVTRRKSRSQYPPILRKPISRAVAILCAAMLLCLSVCAICMISPEIRHGILTALKLDVGNSVDIEGITFTNGGASKIYSDIEELLEDNAIDIMYPHELPEGVRIESVYTAEEELFPIRIVCNTPSVGIGIYKIGTNRNEDLKINAEIEIVNEKAFYVIHNHEKWIALIFDDLYTYEISCTNESDLQIIMKGFK